MAPRAFPKAISSNRPTKPSIGYPNVTAWSCKNSFASQSKLEVYGVISKPNLCNKFNRFKKEFSFSNPLITFQATKLKCLLAHSLESNNLIEPEAKLRGFYILRQMAQNLDKYK